MKTLVTKKKSVKQDREFQVLLGLIEQYLKTGKPVGSNSLKDEAFSNLSSATIRNYFAHLEEEGYLLQQHSSGGRIPTDKAYRLYANEYVEEPTSIPEEIRKACDPVFEQETREISSFLQQATGKLADLTETVVFVSAPRFEQDFIVGMKLIPLDSTRCLCVLITDFGDVLTETLYTSQKLSAFSAKRIEDYFQWKLTGIHKPENLTAEEERLSIQFYNELMVRYIISYSQFNSEDIYRTGFSKLLLYPEFQNPTLLSETLSIFENTHGIRLILRECQKLNRLKFWVGEDLTPYSTQESSPCAALAIPYYVNKLPVGALGVFGPVRIPYRKLFAILRYFGERISETLTKNLYKFKINLQKERVAEGREIKLIGQTNRLLLENKSI